MKRLASLFAAAGAVASISAFALAGGAGAASSPATLGVTLTGTTGVSVSSNDLPQGAVTITATKSGHGSFGIVRLNPNESPSAAIAAGFAAVGNAHGNLDALTATGDSLIVSADAPGTVQTTLTPGNYVALNTSGNGASPSFAQFKVHQTGAPAAVPAAAATETSIEFGFKGPKVLHKGSIVRAVNGGYLVHMDDLIGVKSKAAGQTLVKKLRAGAKRKAVQKYLNGQFVTLMDPASPGAMQQMVLNAKPGFYVQACFMDTQDGRPHVVLGMERLVQVKK
jgi:hypothetical protein